MIRPYLSDIINDSKIPKILEVYSSNEVFDYETQFGEWKIQLSMKINFISQHVDETRNMLTKIDNVEVMIAKQLILLKKSANLLRKNIEREQKDQ